MIERLLFVWVEVGKRLGVESLACACLEQVASLRSARQAHAKPTTDRLIKRKTNFEGVAFALNRLQIATLIPSKLFSFFKAFYNHSKTVNYIFAFALSRLRLPRLCIRLRPSIRNYRIRAVSYLQSHKGIRYRRP